MTATDRQGPSSRPYIGVAVIVVRSGRVLLGMRRNAHGAGTWQFPGGHLEYGESIDACARRELFEETGLSIVDLRRGPFTNDRFTEEHKHYVTLFMIADRTTGTPAVKEPEKCATWEWFRWSDMPRPHFLPIDNLLRQGFSIPSAPSPAAAIREAMAELGNNAKARTLLRFFKTDPGEYAAGDRFLGIPVPSLRRLAASHRDASMAVIEDLLHAEIHEQRQLALLLLVDRFRRADAEEQAAIVDFYLANSAHVNNWDLVDASAHRILGAYLLTRDSSLLDRLARSPDMWERRIAIVATWQFIRAGRTAETMRLAKQLLTDGEDLIHKAVGWMLREVGKRDAAALDGFLRTHYRRMPRTMLRAAIERLPAGDRRAFLAGTR